MHVTRATATPKMIFVDSGIAANEVATDARALLRPGGPFGPLLESFVLSELTTAAKLMSVAGGGDPLAALAHAGVLERLSYVSTAGGAFLEWLEGKDLPGVAALRRS